uniref:Putative tail tape measure protein n=1 Tax=viral metagenome TaxID=1070528 RepID=A0A6M3XFX5_9ZZZZ
MADCSELSKLITDMAMNIASRDDIKNLDDVIAEMQGRFPDVHRDAFVEAIVEATTREAREVDTLAKKLSEIKRQAKTESTTKEKITKLENYLETGNIEVSQKRTKETTFTIEQLRKTRDNLNKWLKTSDPAMKKRLQERLKMLQDAVENGEIEVQAKGKFHELLQPILDDIENAKTKIRDAKEMQALQDKVDALQKHLEEGTLPEKGIRRTREHTEAYNTLIEIRDDLKKQLAQSEPARKIKLEAQIKTLEDRIASGDILPRPRTVLAADTKELQRLEYERDTLKRQIRDQIYDLKPKTLWQRIAGPFNLARLLQTTGEFSLILRQSGFYIYGHPVKGAKLVVDAFKAFASLEYTRKVNQEIFSRELAPVSMRAKLHISPIEGDVRLSKQEEAFMTRWMDKIPVVKNFTRAMLTFINKVRADSFDTLYRTVGMTDTLTDGEAKAIANFINVSTGRGSLGKMEIAATQLNTVFYAPKYVASRFQLLFGQPMFQRGSSAAVRKAIAKEYARFFLGLMAVYALGAAAGGEIEKDPRSSDFGKIRFGKTRIDPLMGLSQVTVFLTRLVSGQTKNAQGEIIPIRGQNVPYGRTTTPDVIMRFLRSKLSPLIATPIDILSGKNVVGEEVTIKSTAKNLAIPFTWGDIVDVMKEQGLPEATAMSIVTFFGMGMQTYGDKNSAGKTFKTSRPMKR